MIWDCLGSCFFFIHCRVSCCLKDSEHKDRAVLEGKYAFVTFFFLIEILKLRLNVLDMFCDKLHILTLLCMVFVTLLEEALPLISCLQCCLCAALVDEGLTVWGAFYMTIDWTTYSRLHNHNNFQNDSILSSSSLISPKKS